MFWIASSSMGKQSGALRSSKLIAENIGAMLNIYNINYNLINFTNL